MPSTNKAHCSGKHFVASPAAMVSEGSRSGASRVLQCRVIAGVVAPVLLLCGIALVTYFVLQEDWNSVLTASLLFFSGFQLFYWYLRTRTLLEARGQIRAGHVVPTDHPAEVLDDPPSYDEVLKTEPPPPAYYTVVADPYKYVPSPVPRSFSVLSLNASAPLSMSQLNVSMPPPYVKEKQSKGEWKSRSCGGSGERASGEGQSGVRRNYSSMLARPEPIMEPVVQSLSHQPPVPTHTPRTHTRPHTPPQIHTHAHLTPRTHTRPHTPPQTHTHANTTPRTHALQTGTQTQLRRNTTTQTSSQLDHTERRAQTELAVDREYRINID